MMTSDSFWRFPIMIAPLLAFGLPAAAAPLAPLSVLVGTRRVAIAIGDAGDPRLAEQRRAIAGWRGAADRDVSLVTIDGDRVEDAADDAASLRRRYGLPPHGFTVVLVGKDGHVALRSPRVLSGAALQSAIDAMPMRRAGLR